MCVGGCLRLLSEQCPFSVSTSVSPAVSSLISSKFSETNNSSKALGVDVGRKLPSVSSAVLQAAAVRCKAPPDPRRSPLHLGIKWVSLFVRTLVCVSFSPVCFPRHALCLWPSFCLPHRLSLPPSGPLCPLGSTCPAFFTVSTSVSRALRA